MQKISARPFLAISIFIVTLVVFSQTASHPFINFDDYEYITRNKQVTAGLSPGGVLWALTATAQGNWHPVTWISHMLDCQLFGLSAGAHHMVNVLFHGINAVLLFLFLSCVTGATWRSAFAASLFALHPLHVESVAWVSERKDLLSTMFMLLALHAYFRYARSSSFPWYLLSLGAFLLGLMSKPMVVTLPLLLLLLDYWPLGRLKAAGSPIHKLGLLLREKVPFIFLAAITSAITVIAQYSGRGVVSIGQLPLSLRIENALISYAQYLGKMFWPLNLAVFYPFPANIPPWQVIGALLILSGISFVAIRSSSRAGYLFMGWFWFIITLLPVIGLVQVGRQGMADRYTYIPLIGLFIIIAWGIPEFILDRPWRVPLLSVAAILVLGCLTVVTNKQVGYWRNSISLYDRSMEVTPPNSFIHVNKGAALVAQARFDEAMAEFLSALNIDHREDAAIHRNLGYIMSLKGSIGEAIGHYAQAVRLEPDNIESRTAYGIILASQGMYDKAREHFAAVLRMDPDNRAVQNYLLMVEADIKKQEDVQTKVFHGDHLRPEESR